MGPARLARSYRGVPGGADSEAAPGTCSYGQWCVPDGAGLVPDGLGAVLVLVVLVAAVSCALVPPGVPLPVAATAATDPTPAMATAATPVASAVRAVKRFT